MDDFYGDDVDWKATATDLHERLQAAMKILKNGVDQKENN